MTGPTTWTVAGITGAVSTLLAQHFGSTVWIEGEITNLKRAPNGHVYFSLVEPGSQGPGTPSLSVSLLKWNREQVNTRLTRAGGAFRMSDGVRVRIGGQLEVYGARSLLQLRMVDIDPEFTLGAMASDYARVLSVLETEGLLDLNRQLGVAPVPLRVAVITSLDSAAHADFITELGRTWAGVELVQIDSRVQGRDAPESLRTALGLAIERAVDLIAIVRGGGARTDLAAFDDEFLARAIATSPVPVWCGLGHETDNTVADRVCNLRFKTPTAVAAALTERYQSTLELLADAELFIRESSVARLHHAEELVARISSDLLLAVERSLNTSSQTLESVAATVYQQAGELCGNAELQVATLDRELALLAVAALDREAERLRSFEAMIEANDPRHLFDRGWTMTRTSTGAVASAGSGQPGGELVTTLADGVVRSAVTNVDHSPGASPLP